MANWKVVAEKSISFNFACDNCKAEAVGIGPVTIAHAGPPTCFDCDQEMTLESCEFDTDSL